MHKVFKVFFVVLLICFAVISCRNDEVDKSGIFSIDSTMIDKILVVDTLGIQFHPPFNWHPEKTSLNNKRVADYSQGLRNYESYTFTPIGLCYDIGSKSILNYGVINHDQDSLSTKEIIDEFIKLATKRYKNIRIERETFTNNGVEFYLARYAFKSWYNARVFFLNERNEIIQMSYAIFNDSKLLKLPAIESSIGTIRLIEK